MLGENTMHGAWKLTCRALKISWGLREASPLKCARKITPARTGQLKWPARQTVSRSIIPAHAHSLSFLLFLHPLPGIATQLRSNCCSACFSHQVRENHCEKRDQGSAQLLGDDLCTAGSGQAALPMLLARPCTPQGARALPSNWMCLFAGWTTRLVFLAVWLFSARSATPFRLMRSLSLASPCRPCSSRRPIVCPCANDTEFY